MKRLRCLLRDALERLDRKHHSNDLDETFCETWRDSLLEAGATEREIDCAAADMVTRVVETTQDQPQLRREQLELIAHHLASTDMTVRIGQDDSYVWVQFPGRPGLH